MCLLIFVIIFSTECKISLLELILQFVCSIVKQWLNFKGSWTNYKMKTIIILGSESLYLYPRYHFLNLRIFGNGNVITECLCFKILNQVIIKVVVNKVIIKVVLFYVRQNKCRMKIFPFSFQNGQDTFHPPLISLLSLD